MFEPKNGEFTRKAERIRVEDKSQANFATVLDQTLQPPNCLASPARAICILSSSPLAAQHLVMLLQHCSELNPMMAEDFLSISEGVPNPIFVLDCACLNLPTTECVRKLDKRFKNARYIVIDNIQTEEDAVSRVALGVHGILEYSKVGAQLEAAVRSVANDRLFFSDGVLAAYVRSSANPKRGRSSVGISSTTPREREILELVKRRLSNKEIALVLGLQESTVKFHLGNILGKLQVPSRYDLTQSTKQAWETMLA